MRITPNNCSPGDRFLFLIEGEERYIIYTLEGFSINHGSMPEPKLKREGCEGMSQLYSSLQPNAICVPKKATKDQIETLVRILS